MNSTHPSPLHSSNSPNKHLIAKNKIIIDCKKNSKEEIKAGGTNEFFNSFNYATQNFQWSINVKIGMNKFTQTDP